MHSGGPVLHQELSVRQSLRQCVSCGSAASRVTSRAPCKPASRSISERQATVSSLSTERVCVCVCVKGVGAGGVCLVRHHSNGVHGNLTPEKCSTAPKIGPEHNHMPPPSSDSLHCFQRSRGVWHNCRESAGEKTTW